MDPDAQRERRRMVMTLNIGDPAIEWLRPLPPDLKMIGPILPEPARPLPADLEVCTILASRHGDSSGHCLTLPQVKHKINGEFLAMQ